MVLVTWNRTLKDLLEAWVPAGCVAIRRGRRAAETEEERAAQSLARRRRRRLGRVKRSRSVTAGAQQALSVIGRAPFPATRLDLAGGSGGQVRVQGFKVPR